MQGAKRVLVRLRRRAFANLRHDRRKALLIALNATSDLARQWQAKEREAAVSLDLKQATHDDAATLGTAFARGNDEAHEAIGVRNKVGRDPGLAGIDRRVAEAISAICASTPG